MANGGQAGRAVPDSETEGDAVSSDSERTPLVSVVTVCLNAREHVAEAMRSVLDQSYSPIEYVVVDGGSADGTVDIIRGFETQFGSRLRWLSEPDGGLYDAMNKGIALATGDLIGTLNADDFYETDAVALAAEAWHARPDVGVLYGDLRTFDAEGNTLVIGTPDSVTLEQLRDRMLLHHPATFVTAETYDRLGDYDLSHPIAADYDFLLRCMDARVPFAKVHAVLTNFSLLGTTHSNVRRTDRDATRVRIEHGVSPLAAWARFYRRAAGNSAYGVLRHIPGFTTAYRNRRASR
jgi:glycosyltransferase involved in cell wall biosynthesis